MLTGPSVGPGMLLTVLMRWPALIVILAVSGGAVYGYKEYGLPDSIELALNQVIDKKPEVKQISDSDHTKVIDHLAEVPKAASAPASAPEPVVIAVLPEPIPEKESTLAIDEKYFVKTGDTLSKIAALRTSSPVNQRDLMNRMFNSNPQAFIEEDPNKLRADVEITIPTK